MPADATFTGISFLYHRWHPLRICKDIIFIYYFYLTGC